MVEGLWWDDQAAEHIRHRSRRYPGASDIEPSATVEAWADPCRVVRDPDPKSQWGYLRVIGYSPSAGAVLTVILRPDDHSGVTAWRTRGADLRAYLDSVQREDS
jgi:hypothetical protein